MKNWMRRTRGAIGMGVTWAVGWAVAGLMIGVSSILLPALPWDVFFDVFDAPLPMLALPGFICGALFSIVLGIAARRRRFDELSLPKFAAWGALGGLLLSLFPLTLAGVGMLSGGDESNLLRATVVISGPFTILAALSATASLMLARRAQDRQAPRSSDDVAHLRPVYGEAQGMLDGTGTARFHEKQAARPRERARPDQD